MQRGHKLADHRALELPETFDASGVPCLDAVRHHRRAPSHHRRHPSPAPLPGLAPTSVIASVEDVAAKGDVDWLVWGCAGDRPVLFSVEAAAAAEMLHAVERGETATAIIEPGQLLLERLD